MTEPRTSQPPLAELLARFLQREPSGGFSPGEVVPYEAIPVQQVDARVAWQEAGEALRCFEHGSELPTDLPGDWGTVVAGQEPAAAVAFCAGNYPQLVRDVHALLKANDLSEL